MSNPFVTTGVDGEAPRLELHDFRRDKMQFELYVQALQIMQIEEDSKSKVTEQDPDSHFQIGAIHGAPYVPWTGDTMADPLLPGVEYGYCTHGNNLFPTWHRPYLSLYEQTLQKHAKAIAEKYPDDQHKEGWRRIAQNLRIPYWDWANPNTVIPPKEWTEEKELYIHAPDGAQWIDNPLLRYKFKTPLDYTQRGRHHHYTETNRLAVDEKAFKDRFNKKNVDKLRQTVLDFFDPAKPRLSWDTFSNHTASDGQWVENSLEGIHDDVHDFVGGFMGDPARAGFDPIFYSHHCNVDRILALWQSYYPDVWVTPGSSRSGTNTIKSGSTVDVNTGLTPFWKSKSEFFDSTVVRDFRHLGYDYKDFTTMGVDRNDPEAVKKGIRKLISELYGSFDPNIRKYLPHDNHHVVEAIKSKVNTPADAESALDKLLLAFTAHVEVDSADTQIFHPHRLEYFEWTARVRVKHYALNESFGVHFYLDPPSGASEKELEDSFVGSFHAFVNSMADSCANCRDQADAVDEGYVYLNATVAERSGVNSFKPENLLPYLTSKLSWKVKKLDGEEVPLDQVPSLEVVLHHVPAVLEAGGTRPTKGNLTRYPVLNAGF